MSTRNIAAAATRQINAVVVSAGLMEKTVKVRIGVQKWNAHIRKNFNRREHLLVHDPRQSLRVGDIVSVSPGWRTSKHVHHVVNAIVAPFGEPIEARPPVPSEAERLAERALKKKLKDERRAEARRADGLLKSEEQVLAGVQEAREKAGEVKDLKGVNV